MEQRLQKLTGWMREKRVDAIWITSPINFFYLTGCYVEPHERLLGLFLFREDSPVLICPKLEMEIVKMAGWKHKVIIYDDMQDPYALLQANVKKWLSASEVVAIEKKSMIYSDVLQFTSIFDQKIELVGVDEEINRLRMVKDETEMNQLKKAAQLADEAMQVAVESIDKGCTELDVVSEIECAMKKRGIDQMAFEPIVLFGEKTALPHGRPDQTVLHEGDLILIDLGIRVNGYCSDLTRTFAYQTVSAIQLEMMNVVLEAQQAALAACQPQVQINKIDESARSVIRENGWGDYFIHRTGHGLGLGIHEHPSISGNNQEYLHPRMVITIEPGVYIPKVGGVRVEDDVMITEEGAQLLTHFPRNVQIVE